MFQCLILVELCQLLKDHVIGRSSCETSTSLADDVPVFDPSGVMSVIEESRHPLFFMQTATSP